MRTTKEIKFDFIEILTKKIKDNTEVNQIYNMDNVFGKIYNDYGLKHKLYDTVKKCMGDKARIQKIVKHEVAGVWEIQALRLKETASFSGIADDNGDFILHDLEDGKYVGESSTLLYDYKNDILLIQRNYGSLTPTGIEYYFNELLKDDKEIFFNTIMKKNLEIDEFLNNTDFFRNLDIGITFKNNEDYSRDNELISSLANMSKKGAKTVRITLSVGKGATKEDTLSPGLIRDTISELYKDPKVTALKLKYKEGLDRHVEKIDLLDNREILDINITQPKKLALSHDLIYPILHNEYCKLQRINDTKNIKNMFKKQNIENIKERNYKIND